MNKKPRPETLAVPYVAALLGISRAAAYRVVAAGQIRALRLGRRLLVPRAELRRLLGEDVPRSHQEDAADAAR